MQRLRYIGFAAFGGDSECGKADGLRLRRKLAEVLESSLRPRNRTCIAGFRHSSGRTAHGDMLSYLTTTVNWPGKLGESAHADRGRVEDWRHGSVGSAYPLLRLSALGVRHWLLRRTYPGFAIHPARASGPAFPCRVSECPRPIQDGRGGTSDYPCGRRIDPESGPIIPAGRSSPVPP